MHWLVVQRLLGMLLMAFSGSMLPPMLIALFGGDGQFLSFLISLLVTFVLGGVLWLPVRRQQVDLRARDGFIIVTLFWTVLGVLSGIPFLFSTHLSITDAVFESVSGFTTTGATVITGLDGLPPSILYYRQQLQWLGGMGIILLAVAIFPMLGVGGMQLYRAETPGPIKDEKITPRIANTAQALWLIYLGLTVACALAYWWAGMSLFDAIGHSFSTVATGGFSTHDASLGHFNSLTIETIANVFMLAGGINFAVHFVVWRRGRYLEYWRNAEVQGFLVIVAGLSIATAALLWWLEYYPGLGTALRHAVFHVISIITTTGFTTQDFSLWPSFLPIMLIYISFIGGCAGSTAGGMKVVRVLLLLKQGLREVHQLIHPRSVIPIKIGNKPMEAPVVNAVWGFFALYVFATATLTLLMVGTGLDVLSAYAAVATCLNVTGPGLGVVTSNFIQVSDPGKWLAIFTMLLGRLEVFTLLVLLTPAFWRQ